MSPAAAGLEVGAQALEVGHKLLLGTVCPLTVLSAVVGVPVLNECRLDGRTDGIHVGCRF